MLHGGINIVQLESQKIATLAFIVCRPNVRKRPRP